MKVIISIIFAFVISIGIFLGAIFLYQYTIEDGKIIQINKKSILEEKFYSQNFTKQKIFILGSSMVSALNTTYIQEYLLKNNYDYEIYNLAVASDKPIKRLNTLDMIIKTQPDIIVYGIGFRDIHDEVLNGKLKSQTLFPDPEQFFTEFLWSIQLNYGVNFDILSSTRTVSFGVIDNFINKGFINPRFEKELTTHDVFENTPFFPYYKKDSIIMSDNEIEAQIKETPLYVINPPEKNKNIIALKRIVHALQENDVQVIIFTTPVHKLFFEISPNYDEKAFNRIVENMMEYTHLKVNFLHNKYNQSQVWQSQDHLAVNNATFYSEDIAKIILDELNK